MNSNTIFWILALVAAPVLMLLMHRTHGGHGSHGRGGADSASTGTVDSDSRGKAEARGSAHAGHDANQQNAGGDDDAEHKHRGC